MQTESAVQFATDSRIHLGLAVKDLERSVAFYRALLGQEPTKRRPHYAKFEVAEPPLNLALNAVPGPTGPNNPVAHFGIQVKTTEAVGRFDQRLNQAGHPTRAEENVSCCYAVQNKVWAADPDGNKWEVYVVLDDDGTQHRASSECCVDAAQKTEGQADQTAACGCSAAACC
jgi:catechol 2,3-dioxygenase-like lactoylglutathione lyase family enzyme